VRVLNTSVIYNGKMRVKDKEKDVNLGNNVRVSNEVRNVQVKVRINLDG
jgi:hypothetical protein